MFPSNHCSFKNAACVLPVRAPCDLCLARGCKLVYGVLNNVSSTVSSIIHHPTMMRLHVPDVTKAMGLLWCLYGICLCMF